MLRKDPESAHSLRIVHVEQIGSTNAEAMRLAIGGDEGPLWVRADRQTAGRGRSGRTWTSESGNLYASLMLRLATAGAPAYQLSLVAGVAVIEAIRECVPLKPATALRLKWPNDILVGDAKAGGILVESSTLAPSASGLAGPVAVIGVGLNIVSHPGDLDRAATHLGEHCASTNTVASADVLLRAIAAAMQRWLDVWDDGRDFAAVRNAWLLSGHPIGERIGINTGAEQFAGTFAGLDADGALLLRVDGRSERRFTFGDVSLPAQDLRPLGP